MSPLGNSGLLRGGTLKLVIVDAIQVVSDLPFGGTWTFELSPQGKESELRITEDGFVSNTLFRFLARFVFGHTGSMEGFLRQLGAKFGEQTVVED